MAGNCWVNTSGLAAFYRRCAPMAVVGPPAAAQARWPLAGLPCSGERPRGTGAQAGGADVCPLSFRVAGAVAVAAVGQAGLAGEWVGLLDVAADDLPPVGQHERHPGAGGRSGRRSLAGGPVLRRPGPGHHGGGEPEQPTAPPGPGAAAPVRNLRRGQPLPHLHHQRGVKDIGPLDVGGEPEHMDPGARIRAWQYDALAAHRRGETAEQVRLDARPRVVDVQDPIGRAIGLWPLGGEQRAVDSVLCHQFRGLGGQCLCLGRRDALSLGLREQLADAGEQRVRRLGTGWLGVGPRSCCLGIHEAVSCSGRGIEYVIERYPEAPTFLAAAAVLAAPYRRDGCRRPGTGSTSHPGRSPPRGTPGGLDSAPWPSNWHQASWPRTSPGWPTRPRRSQAWPTGCTSMSWITTSCPTSPSAFRWSRRCSSTRACHWTVT